MENPSTNPPSQSPRSQLKNQFKEAASVSTNPVTVCFNTRYDVVKNCCQNAGYVGVSEEESWILYWIDTGVCVERILAMKPYQKINHFPSMSEICRKDYLARNLGTFRRLFPKEYRFFPKSWVLPQDWENFKLESQKKNYEAFIAKPGHGCQGKGIFIFQSWKDIAPTANMVVQSYIHRPLLISNFKFDIRLYVLITSIDPFNVYLYEDGLARFATEPYVTPNTNNIKEMRMHLTNYAINKDSDKFDRTDSDEKGSKRRWTSALRTIEKMGYDVEDLKRSIQDVVVKTIITIQPQIRKVLEACFRRSSTKTKRSTVFGSASTLNDSTTSSETQSYGSPCFEILGFDILLEERSSKRLKPWVLEVNHSPSFTCDSQLDLEIKEGVIGDALKLINLDSENMTRWHNEEKARARQRLRKCGNGWDSSASSTTLCTELPRLLGSVDGPASTRHYNTHDSMVDTGRYTRIFPSSDSERQEQYEKFLEAAENLYGDTTSTKARKAYLQEKKKKEMEEVTKKQVMTARWKGDLPRNKEYSAQARYLLPRKPTLPPVKRIVPPRDYARVAAKVSITNIGWGFGLPSLDETRGDHIKLPPIKQPPVVDSKYSSMLNIY